MPATSPQKSRTSSRGKTKSPKKKAHGTSPYKKARTTIVALKDSEDSRCHWDRLPAELHGEIYEYLTPSNLLNLSRVSKAFYEFFKSSASTLYWTRARKKVTGLPACPPWLSEIQYASLCFDKYCQHCLQEDESTELALWPLSARYCIGCKSVKTIALSCLEGLSGFGRKIEKILPFFYDTRDDSVVRQAYFLRSDVDNFSQLLDDAMDREDVAAQRQALTEERRRFAARCDRWERAMEAAKRQHLDDIREARFDDIYAIVQAHDYGPEMFNLGLKLEALPPDLRHFVQKAEPLSNKERKNIMPLLKTALLERRNLENRRLYVDCMLVRLDRMDEALFDHRPDSSSLHEIFPSALDLVDIPAVRYLVQLEREVKVFSDAFKTIVPKRIPEWRNAREKVVLDLLPDLVPIVSKSHLSFPSSMTTRSTPLVSPLEHHGALFWCDCCNQLVSGIAAQIHACCYRFDPGWRFLHPPGCSPWTDGRYSRLVTEGDPTLDGALLIHSRGFLPWCGDSLRPCTHAVFALWKACGVDVASQASKAVVEGARFACSFCSVPGKVMVAMDWRRAIHHVFAEHGGARAPWQKVHSVIADKVKRLERDGQSVNSSGTELDERWTCPLCSWPRANRAYRLVELEEHFETEHPYNGGIYNHDAIRSSDSPEPMHPCVVLFESTLGGDDLDAVVIGLEGLKGARKTGKIRFPKNAWMT